MSNLQRIMAKVAYLKKLSEGPMGLARAGLTGPNMNRLDPETEAIEANNIENRWLNDPYIQGHTIEVPSGLAAAGLNSPSNPNMTDPLGIGPSTVDILQANNPFIEEDTLRQYLKNDYIRTLLGMSGGALIGAGAGALTGISPSNMGLMGAATGGLVSALTPHMIESLAKDNII